MTRDSIPAGRRTHRRAIVLGAMAALALPACASDRPRVQSSDAEASAPSAGTSTAKASPPMGYPWAAGPSLPTASANAPSVAR